MKLRCIDHGARVLAFDGKAFHRTNGERCNGILGLEIGGRLTDVKGRPLESAWDMHLRSIPNHMD